MKIKRFFRLAQYMANQYGRRVTVTIEGGKYVMRVPGIATLVTGKGLPQVTVNWSDGHHAMVESEFLDAFIPAKGSVSV